MQKAGGFHPRRSYCSVLHPLGIPRPNLPMRVDPRRKLRPGRSLPLLRLPQAWRPARPGRTWLFHLRSLLSLMRLKVEVKTRVMAEFERAFHPIAFAANDDERCHEPDYPKL